MANIVTKILTWAGFRVMSTWFAQYIKSKLQADQAWVHIINVSSRYNVEEIVNAFAANPDADQLTVTQQWHGESAPQTHTVYRNIVYIGGTEV